MDDDIIDTQEINQGLISDAHQKNIDIFIGSNNSDKTDKKIIRRNKKLFYHNERNEILQKLIQLINFNNDAQENLHNKFSGARRDKSILLAQLKDNQPLINYLISITDNIKKYYRCSTWGYFVAINNSSSGEIGDEITLLKAIFKDHDYKIFSKDITTEYKNVKKRYTTLFFTI